MAVGAVVGGFDSIGGPLCTRPPMPEYSEGLRVRMTPRWSKGDSNSPSHPERQRSEGRHMVPRTAPGFGVSPLSS